MKAVRLIRVLLLALVICVPASGVYFAHRSGTNPEAYSNDFNVYYYAARETFEGRDPYQRSLAAWTPYLYPPLLAEVLIPLALLPLPVAAYLWFLINVASIIAAAWMSARMADESSVWDGTTSERLNRWVLAAAGAIIVIRFVLDNFDMGQVNPLMTGLAVAHLYLYSRGRKAMSAVALALAISIKLTPALLIFFHLAKLRIKYAAACVALVAGLIAVSFLPFGIPAAGAYRTFVDRTISNGQGYDLADPGNQSLRGLIARISKSSNGESDPSRTRAVSTTTAVTLLASVLLLAVAMFAAARARGLAAAAPFFCCTVILSPLSWKAHYVMLILPIVYLLSVVRSASRGRGLIIGTLATAFLLFNFTSPKVSGLTASEWVDSHSMIFIGAGLIFLTGVIAALTGKFGNQSRVC